MSELQRYGLEWKSETDFVCHPMADGYWTPWHIATEENTRLQSEVERLWGRVAELIAYIKEEVADGHTYKDYENILEGDRTEAWLLRTEAEGIEKAVSAVKDNTIYTVSIISRAHQKALASMENEAQRLRQQADELEHPDGRP